MIDGYWSGGPVYTEVAQEATLFWADLSQAGLIDGTLPAGGANYAFCGQPAATWTLTGGTSYIGNFLPVAKIGNGNFVYVYDSNTNNSPGSLQPGLDNNNWFGIAAFTSVLTDGQGMSNPAMLVIQAYNIDKKIDDGIPNQGNVRAYYVNDETPGYANAQVTDSATSCFNTTTNTYSTNITGGNGQNCALSLRLQ